MAYDEDALEDDGLEAPPGEEDYFGSGDMPIAEVVHASYTVRRDYVVRGAKMIYMSNRIKEGGKAWTIGRVQPYLGKGTDR